MESRLGASLLAATRGSDEALALAALRLACVPPAAKTAANATSPTTATTATTTAAAVGELECAVVLAYARDGGLRTALQSTRARAREVFAAFVRRLVRLRCQPGSAAARHTAAPPPSRSSLCRSSLTGRCIAARCLAFCTPAVPRAPGELGAPAVAQDARRRRDAGRGGGARA